MSKLTEKQNDALEQLLSTKSTNQSFAALDVFTKALPQRSSAKREEVAQTLIERLTLATTESPKAKGRLLLALAAVDTANAAEVVARYGRIDSDEADDRVQVWALTSLSRMTAYENSCQLFQDVLENDCRNNRVRGLLLRLLIQCHAEDMKVRDEYIAQLLEMGKHQDADHKWAALRALRNDLNLLPLMAEVEKQFVWELVVPTLRDDFEWQDVQIQATLVLGDAQANLSDAFEGLATAFRDSANATIRRYCIVSMRRVAARMSKKEREASAFNKMMLTALADESTDVRSRARTALKAVLGPKVAIETVVEALLQETAVSPDLVEALRAIDGTRANTQLRENLMNLNPEAAQRASEALMQLGGEQAFRTLFAQRSQTIERYTDILNDADEKIMGQYNSLMHQARWAFWISMGMHVLIFLIGVTVLGGTIIYYLATEPEQVWGWFAGTGVGLLAAFLGLFYKNPVANIGHSVTRLIKINVAFLGYMRQINQIDATFKQLFLATSGFSLDEMKETVLQIREVVDQSLQKIQHYLAGDDVLPTEREA